MCLTAVVTIIKESGQGNCRAGEISVLSGYDRLSASGVVSIVRAEFQGDGLNADPIFKCTVPAHDPQSPDAFDPCEICWNSHRRQGLIRPGVWHLLIRARDLEERKSTTAFYPPVLRTTWHAKEQSDEAKRISDAHISLTDPTDDLI